MRNRFLKYTLFISGIILLFISCERDDICPATTPTTPSLIVQFFDVSEPDENKAVRGLSYITENSSDTISLGNTDSIALPLNTNQNVTKLQLIRNTNDANFRNVDTIRFIYEVNEVYVNRACGFKAIFRNLSAIRTAENPVSNNWIRSISTPPEQLNVINEQNTHVFILH